jgi:NAD(P)-dependent dehydrogenase (short-subunit alcohol dehydrogenase family)
VAKAFAAAGCRKIAITDVNETLLKQTGTAIRVAHPHVITLEIAGDISSEAFVDSFVDEVFKCFGRIDYCVNCAGILGKSVPSTETSLEEFDRVNNVNYRGCWLSSRAELRAMLKQDPLPSHDSLRPPQRGSIINIASQLAIVGRAETRKSDLCQYTFGNLVILVSYNIKQPHIPPRKLQSLQ